VENRRPETTGKCSHVGEEGARSTSDCTKLGVLEEFSELRYEVKLANRHAGHLSRLSRAHIPGSTATKGSDDPGALPCHCRYNYRWRNCRGSMPSPGPPGKVTAARHKIESGALYDHLESL